MFKLSRQDVIDSVTDLVTSKFAGDYKKAFTAYDKDGDGFINRDEMNTVLSDAGYGMLTRSFVLRAVMKELDPDGDDKISWTDFEKHLKNTNWHV